MQGDSTDLTIPFGGQGLLCRAWAKQDLKEESGEHYHSYTFCCIYSWGKRGGDVAL